MDNTESFPQDVSVAACVSLVFFGTKVARTSVAAFVPICGELLLGPWMRSEGFNGFSFFSRYYDDFQVLAIRMFHHLLEKKKMYMFLSHLSHLLDPTIFSNKSQIYKT